MKQAIAPSPNMTSDQRESNKSAVVAFYDAAYNKKDFDAASVYLGTRFVQHDPIVADGRDGFRDRVAWFRANFPELKVTIHRIFADGDFVITHVHGVREPGHSGSAIVEIFRLEDGLIVEHWDVIQEIPDQAVHDNGMI